MDTIQRPLWFRSTVAGLVNACENYRIRYRTAGVILGFNENQEGRKIGYLIRLGDGNVGYFTKKSLTDKELPTAMKVKGILPEPHHIEEEPEYVSFIFQTVREQVKLIPLLWLKSVLQDILSGNSKTEIYEKRFIEFKRWVKAPEELKRNRKKMEVIRLLLEIEGPNGLTKCNDWVE